MPLATAEIGSEERRLAYRPAEYWAEHYWQVDTDPGQRLPTEFYLYPNRTMRQRLFCGLTFGNEECPKPVDSVPSSSSDRGGGLLFYNTLGRLSNCLVTLELARWLAEQLGKTLVVPLCSSGENTEQSCTVNSTREDQKEINLLVNLTAIYSRSSLGGCRHRREARDTRDVLNVLPLPPSAPRALTCIGKSAWSCAWMLGTDHKAGPYARLSSWVDFDAGALATSWMEYAATRSGADGDALHESRALRRALRRQDEGEACAPRILSSGCGCTRDANGTRHCLPRDRANASLLSLPPCLRDCYGRSIFDVTAGDVFMANLFEYSAPTVEKRHAMCPAPTLSPRPAEQAATLRASLPERFVCLHWRAGDFLNPVPLGRLRGQSMLHRNRALANASFMAAVAARAASNVQAKHVLVLTNARYQRAKLFESTLATLTGGTIGATVRLCTNAPPDAEKEVCSRAAALLLTRESSFSTQVHRMAMAANGGQYDEKGHDERHEYLSYCPKKDAWLWQKERLLRGVPIPCS